MKYISYRKNVKGGSREFIIVFPGGSNHFSHKEVVEMFGIDIDDILGAGFFMEIKGRKVFNGESLSLGIVSRGEVDRDLFIAQAMK